MYDVTSNSSTGAISQNLSSDMYTVVEDADNSSLIVTIPENIVKTYNSSFLLLFNLLPNLDGYVPMGDTDLTLNIAGGYGTGETSRWSTRVQVPSPTIRAIDSSSGAILDTTQSEDLIEYMTSATIFAPSITDYSLDITKSEGSQIITNDSLDGNKIVDFYYTKDPVVGGDVTTKYTDTDGNKISEDVVKSGNVGDDYSTEQKNISGYTFKEVQGDASGKFTDQPQSVTYIYTKDPVAGGDVTTKYTDTDGNKISEDVVKSGNVGDDYSTEQKNISGYTFKEVQGDASGKFTDQPQSVTYIYTKDPVAGGDVTTKYTDTDGNKISEDVVKSGNVGDDYSTEQKNISGYTFKEVQGDASGKFTDQPQSVTYTYTKDSVALSPAPDIHSDTTKGHKSSTNKTDISSENKTILPQTGENEELSLIGMFSGFLLIIGTIIMIIFNKKGQD